MGPRHRLLSASQLEQALELRDRGPNTTSIRGVDWTHKDLAPVLMSGKFVWQETTDVFRTTYSDTLSSIRV